MLLYSYCGKRQLSLDSFSPDFRYIEKLNKELEAYVKSPVYNNAFEWRFEFPEVLDDEGNFVGFDIIIANPPYVFARENFTTDMKDFFIQNYKASQYQVNLFMLFIERAIPLLKSKGRYSFIVPNSLLMVSSAQKLRKYLLEETALDEIINLMGNTFEGINVETIIISGKRQNKDHSNKTSIYVNEGTDFNLSHLKEQSLFLQNEGGELTVFSSDISDSLTVKLRNGSQFLNDVVKVKAGLQAYEANKGVPKQTAEDVKARPYDYKYKFDENTYKYLEGKDVCRYELKWSGAYLRYGNHLAAPRTFDIFSGKKIIVREITGRYPQSIISTYSDDVFLFNRSNIAIVENEHSTVSLKFILVVLNSKLMSHYFMNNTAKSVRQLFPKLILEDLRKFPIKEIDFESQRPFIELVDKTLDARKEGKDSIDLESEIDRLVYKLYDLTEDEIKIIEQATK